MYYASCSIPKTNSVKCWIQPCPIAATLCFCQRCENVEMQILADAQFPAVRKNTQRNQPKHPSFLLADEKQNGSGRLDRSEKTQSNLRLRKQSTS